GRRRALSAAGRRRGRAGDGGPPAARHGGGELPAAEGSGLAGTRDRGDLPSALLSGADDHRGGSPGQPIQGTRRQPEPASLVEHDRRLEEGGRRRMNAQAQYRLGLILVTASALAWSSAGYFTRLIPLDNWTLVFWRGVFAAIGMLAFIAVLQGK